MRFRAATPADVPVLLPIIEAAYRGEGGWTTEAHLLGGQRTDAVSLAETAGMLVVEGDGGVLGCCQLDLSGPVAYFGTFAVQPTAQGRGIGAALLAEAERRAAGRALEMTVIAQRSELIAWYDRRGYAPTGEQRPFPYGQEKFGLPKRDDLVFVVLRKQL